MGLHSTSKSRAQSIAAFNFCSARAIDSAERLFLAVRSASPATVMSCSAVNLNEACFDACKVLVN